MFQLRADGDARCLTARCSVHAKWLRFDIKFANAYRAFGTSVAVELPYPNEATGSICFKQIELVMVTGRDGCVE
jgi:hypothetical protein